MMDKLSGSCLPTVRHAVSPSILDRFSIKSRRSSFEYSQSAQKLRPEHISKASKATSLLQVSMPRGLSGLGLQVFCDSRFSMGFGGYVISYIR